RSTRATRPYRWAVSHPIPITVWVYKSRAIRETAVKKIPQGRYAHDRSNKTAVPRRPCRLDPALGAAQGGAREMREGSERGRRPQGGGRGGNSKDHRQAGGTGPQARDRWRISPLVVALRLLRHA